MELKHYALFPSMAFSRHVYKIGCVECSSTVFVACLCTLEIVIACVYVDKCVFVDKLQLCACLS